MNKRRVAILGSTGSIGRQALDVIRQHRDLFEVELLTANNSSELLIAQAREFDVNSAVICNEEKYDEVASALQKDGIKVFAGMDSVCSLVGGSNIDIVLTAMVGFSGLASTVAAIKAGKAIALANKETLVAAGSLVTALAREHGVPLLPVDSEHSAIFQCLQGCGNNRISRIHLTASGGPFREWSREKIAAAGPREALRHPNWQMGSKITIDSATMMNKGLEVIEAKWLFDVEPEDIRVVVHPESIIHSMVEFADGAVIAQLGHPDMREPIQYALAYPQRLNLDNRKLDFAALGSLSFSAPDTERFPALGLAYEALRRGGNLACTMNAANEIAVAAYLREEISFYGISDIVAETMAGVEFAASPSLDDIFATNEAAKEYASALIEKRKGRW
ncbi:MAG: 1-deoxy-D-xylulose-5-phosphate reductoisomerase [Candidatus Cryptobacteroides sp.]|nr:1-deoxy-D-xylulose-5-phosphate reductoisomerase [Bacteroidales bacterium]MCI6314446.1 1-deoxy-D-xylulose-5-phosphate reductoisomerase [Bacteroidales bacterium]MCI7749839.1 1-deoxy-D-xylulose-5-phosphate reductoisomerase [Bacteroidales bacterium]MDD6112961.1 1-deoxy-D-xylulose-5-phosphate reductoisomerase [Bacteroidales bacterium]MDY2707784.1 1-deoxy-D-xylulose-5-phosphate reductoisomerase [Candidatus Cryptobacteroides sp.]